MEILTVGTRHVRAHMDEDLRYCVELRMRKEPKKKQIKIRSERGLRNIGIGKARLGGVLACAFLRYEGRNLF
jgi:hypothetical protein